MPRYAHFQLHVLQLLDSFTCFGSSPFKNTFLSSDWMPPHIGRLEQHVGAFFSHTGGLLTMNVMFKVKAPQWRFSLGLDYTTPKPSICVFWTCWCVLDHYLLHNLGVLELHGTD